MRLTEGYIIHFINYMTNTFVFYWVDFENNIIKKL